MSNSPKLYLTGGAIRDRFLGLPDSKDKDYVVVAESFDQMREFILSRDGTIYLETPEYFTIRGNLPKIGPADFVLARKESEYSDNRHPDKVEVGSLFDDLSRRDFTAGAIAEDEEGNIIDPFDGRKDIQIRLLKCVGDPIDRFYEDGLRILRSLRFAITKGFFLDSGIRECLKNPSIVKTLDKVSQERIREELYKCFHFDTLKTLLLLEDYPLVKTMILDKEKFGIWLKPTTELK